jgi:cytochrome P450
VPREFASASLVENVRFNQAVIIPNALQGIFRRRPNAVGVATRAGVDGQAIGLLGELRRKYGPRPLWVRIVKDPALLLLDVADVRRALEGSPAPFASDPDSKRRGMVAFQPDALTISRGDLWQQRRAFAEDVLDTPQVSHRLGERIVAIVAEELGALSGTLDLDALGGAYRRLTRRIVLGDGARDDEQLSARLAELMDQANSMPGERRDPYDAFAASMADYVKRGEQGSLAGLAAARSTPADVRVEGQLTHWLFATADTLAANVLRALALLASHPDARAAVDAEVAVAAGGAAGSAGLSYTRAVLHEAMRLWPTTSMLARETLTTLAWDGVRIDAGTQVLIVNSFHHRDRERLGERADRLSPEAWLDGDFGEDWGFNHLSHGPQGCPGANLALLIGAQSLVTLLAAGPRLERPTLDPARPLPHMLNPYGVSFELA